MSATAKYTIKWFHLRDLRPHPRVQRDYDDVHAKRIAADFDPDRFGTPSIIHAPGKAYYWIFDGQHRVAAAKIALGPDQRVPCAVYEEGIPEEKLAVIARGLNTIKRWRAIDDFRVRVLGKDPVALEINRIIEGHGLKISRQPGPSLVRGVVACEWVYKRISPAILDRALGVLHESWTKQGEALDANLVKGMGLFLSQYGDKIDDRHLVKRLMAHGNPLRLLGHARQLRQVAHMEVPRAVSKILFEEYNKRLRDINKLSEAA
jgi:hypothetical protein